MATVCSRSSIKPLEAHRASHDRIVRRRQPLTLKLTQQAEAGGSSSSSSGAILAAFRKQSLESLGAVVRDKIGQIYM